MAKARKRLKITVEVVPPGSLSPNEHNPFRNMTPKERWDGIVEVCVNIAANAMDGHAARQRSRERDG